MNSCRPFRKATRELLQPQFRGAPRSLRQDSFLARFQRELPKTDALFVEQMLDSFAQLAAQIALPGGKLADLLDQLRHLRLGRRGTFSQLALLLPHLRQLRLGRGRALA